MGNGINLWEMSNDPLGISWTSWISGSTGSPGSPGSPSFDSSSCGTLALALSLSLAELYRTHSLSSTPTPLRLYQTFSPTLYQRPPSSFPAFCHFVTESIKTSWNCTTTPASLIVIVVDRILYVLSLFVCLVRNGGPPLDDDLF